MALSSKEWIIIIIEAIIPLIITKLYSPANGSNFFSFSALEFFILAIFIITVFFFIVGKRLSEITLQLENHEKEQNTIIQRLDEKLKIYDRLAKLEAKEDLLRNGKKI